MCFIYYFEGNRTYGEVTKQIFLYLQEGRLKAVTSVLTIAEILSFEKLQKDRILFDETKHKLIITPNLTLRSVDQAICEVSAILKYKYSLTLPDAIQLATAIINGQKAFVSNDRRFKKVKEIKTLLLDEFL